MQKVGEKSCAARFACQGAAQMKRKETRNFHVTLREGLPEKVKPLAKSSKMTTSEWADETIHRAVKTKAIYKSKILP